MATAQEQRFFTTKPVEIYYETIELHHSQIGTLRYVFRQFEEKTFTIEAGAPRDAGQPVVFMPASGEVTPLTQSDNPVTSLGIQLGRVGQQIKREMKKIAGTGWLEQIECLYRVYDGSKTTAPMNIPPQLLISSVSMTADGVAMTAEDDNPSGVTVARKYLVQDFPGLEAQL